MRFEHGRWVLKSKPSNDDHPWPSSPVVEEGNYKKNRNLPLKIRERVGRSRRDPRSCGAPGSRALPLVHPRGLPVCLPCLGQFPNFNALAGRSHLNEELFVVRDSGLHKLPIPVAVLCERRLNWHKPKGFSRRKRRYIRFFSTLPRHSGNLLINLKRVRKNCLRQRFRNRVEDVIHFSQPSVTPF